MPLAAAALLNPACHVMLRASKPTLRECAMSEQVRGRYWGRQMDDVMSEIARQATICKVKLLDAGVIDAVLRNDESVCGTSNPLSFKKLRNAMLMGFVVKGKSVEALGPVETEGLIAAIRERIKGHLGNQLGGSA